MLFSPILSITVSNTIIFTLSDLLERLVTSVFALMGLQQLLAHEALWT